MTSLIPRDRDEVVVRAAGQEVKLTNLRARCDDVDRLDYLHFDLDPGEARFGRVIETALLVKQSLEALKIRSCVKTSGSKGLHVTCTCRSGGGRRRRKSGPSPRPSRSSARPGTRRS